MQKARKGFEKHKNFSKKGSCFILSDDSINDLNVFINDSEPSDPYTEVIAERRLCNAVLARAVADAIGRTYLESFSNPLPTTGRGWKSSREYISSAKEWFQRSDMEPFSFLWVCETLDFSDKKIDLIRKICCEH